MLAVGSINPADALTIGALLQTSRLFGGEIGTAFMQTFVRMREQVHSNLIGLHVDSLAGLTADRLALYRNAAGAPTAPILPPRPPARPACWRRRSRARRRCCPTSTAFSPRRSAPIVCLLLVAILPAPIRQKSS